MTSASALIIAPFALIALALSIALIASWLIRKQAGEEGL